MTKLPPRLQEFASLLEQGLSAGDAAERMGLDRNAASVLKRRLKQAQQKEQP